VKATALAAETLTVHHDTDTGRDEQQRQVTEQSLGRPLDQCRSRTAQHQRHQQQQHAEHRGSGRPSAATSTSPTSW
jgi:hypothetical protein